MLSFSNVATQYYAMLTYLQRSVRSNVQKAPIHTLEHALTSVHSNVEVIRVGEISLFWDLCFVSVVI